MMTRMMNRAGNETPSWSAALRGGKVRAWIAARLEVPVGCQWRYEERQRVGCHCERVCALFVRTRWDVDGNWADKRRRENDIGVFRDAATLAVSVAYSKVGC